MSVETISTEPYFFGKDTFVPFIGTVEDVDDPKRSNRIKVRCIGWHPLDKNELPSEDLPWAKVCMPTTHAQQAGIGGKHGLLPGCWVIGFFMDGLDAQDPYVFSTFNFTSKVVEENNRKRVDTSSGKTPDNVKGGTKIIVGEQHVPNYSRNTEREQNSQGFTDTTDAARDSVLNSSTDGTCPTTRPASDKLRLKDDKTTENPESQKYKVGLADGICGPLQGAREEIQNVMGQLFPSSDSRFTYGDVVWSAFTGNYIDMNGILLLISKFICSQLKLQVNTMKAFTEDKIMRPKKAAIILSIPDRDGILREAADFASSVASDNFNAAIDQVVSKLCDTVLGVLQKLNNGSEEDNRQQSDEESGGDNRNNRDSKGNVGAKSTTPINFSSSISLTDEILKAVALEVDTAIETESSKALEEQDKIQSDLQEMSDSIKDTDTSSNTCNPENGIKMAEMNISLDDMKNKNNSNSSGGGGEDIGSMLGDAAKYVQMLLELKFAINPNVHSKSGFAVLDQVNAILECATSEARMFETAIGKVGSMAGIDFRNAVTGGGSYSGKSSKITKNVRHNIGFGGIPITDSIKRPGEPLVLSDDSKTPRVNDKKLRREQQPEWGSVEFHDVNRSYELRGEVSFGQRITNNSRILVSNQDDPTENGIYVTSANQWTRVDDAKKPNDFKKYKLISVQGRIEKTERWWYYTGKNNPKLDSNEIKFEPLYVSPGYRPVKKVADITKNIELESLKQIVDDISIDKLTGENSYVISVSVPSGEKIAAENFVSGIPNQLVVTDPGRGYYNESYIESDFEIEPKPGAPSEFGANVFPNNPYSFPSVYIPRYQGTPIPVVDPSTGEIVSILTNFASFNEGSSTVSIIKDNSNIGILSNDPRYDITIGGFFVQNIGQNYTPDVRLEVIDRDTGEQNGQIKPILVEGRIVDVEVINNGTGFKRIPQILIIDSLGAGAKLFPIMSVVARDSNSPSVKPIRESVNMIFCNTKKQKNLIKPGS